jgi:hypothetical protein
MKKLIAKTAIPQAELRQSWQVRHTQSLLMILFPLDFFPKDQPTFGRLALKPQRHLFKSPLHKNSHEFIHK